MYGNRLTCCSRATVLVRPCHCEGGSSYKCLCNRICGSSSTPLVATRTRRREGGTFAET